MSNLNAIITTAVNTLGLGELRQKLADYGIEFKKGERLNKLRDKLVAHLMENPEAGEEFLEVHAPETTEAAPVLEGEMLPPVTADTPAETAPEQTPEGEPEAAPEQAAPEQAADTPTQDTETPVVTGEAAPERTHEDVIRDLDLTTYGVDGSSMLDAAVREHLLENPANLANVAEVVEELAKLHPASTEEQPVKRSSIVPNAYKAKYGKDGNNGDEMAACLKAYCNDPKGKLILDRVHEVQRQNDIDPARWSHLNPGQQRMNTGNVLRGKLKNGQRVQVGEMVWNPSEEEQAATEQAA